MEADEDATNLRSEVTLGICMVKVFRIIPEFSIRLTFQRKSASQPQKAKLGRL